jgi:hypothetical protein
MRGKLKVERTALIVIGALALAGLVVSPAIGLRGALTPLQAKKFFLKKKAAERIYLSKGAAESRFLSKADADARFAPKGEAYSRSESDALYLRPEGTIEVTVGPSEWDYTGGLGPAPTLTRFIDSTRVDSSLAAISGISVSPQAPTVLYGRETKVIAAEVCYDAAPNAQLQYATMQLVEQSTEVAATPPTEVIAIDSTARTDNTCRTYRPQSPVPIGRDKTLALNLLINFTTDASASFRIGRTSFVLLP